MAKIHIGGKRYLQHRDPESLHIGAHVLQFIRAKGITKTELARRTDRNNNTVHETLKKHSMQTDILMEYCHALRRNFFADLAAQLPDDYESAAPGKMAAELEKMRAELEKVKAERDILMSLLRKD